MDIYERLLEVHHEFDAWVQSPHIPYGLIEVNLCCLVRNQLELRRGPPTELSENFRLHCILFELLLLELHLVLFVTELLKCVVEHDFFHLEVCGYREHYHVALPKVRPIVEVTLMEDDKFLGLARSRHILDQLLELYYIDVARGIWVILCPNLHELLYGVLLHG